MCIIAGEIESISKTKLFGGLNSDKSRQITIYSNDVNSINNSAMILPVLNPQSIQFHDLTEYEDFFEDCDECFKLRNQLKSKGMCFSSDCFDENDCLDVIDVGSYKVSVANSLEDLKRIDTNVFTITPNLDTMLADVYHNSRFGFVICALKPGNHEYHPFAYSNDVYKQKMFLPTMHYHVLRNQVGKYQSIADDWSHEIYVCNATPSDKVNTMHENKWIWTNKDKLDRTALGFDLGNITSFHKLKIEGLHPNIDVICAI